MIINSIESIDPNDGDYILLADYGTEGMHVFSQGRTLQDAIISASMNSLTGNVCLVKLVRFFPHEDKFV